MAVLNNGFFIFLMETKYFFENLILLFRYCLYLYLLIILRIIVKFKHHTYLSNNHMHEWALAESILTAALEAAEKEKLKKITLINVSIGELQQIEKDIFEFSINEILKTQNKKLKDVEIKIETEKSILRCKSCDNKWTFDDMRKKLNNDEFEAIHFLPEVAFVHARCPKCGSPDFEITTGRGIKITAIKGEK